MPRRHDPLAAESDRPPTNEERILAVLRDARGYRDDGCLPLADIISRSGVKVATVYLSYLHRQGKVRRVARGVYRLAKSGEWPVENPSADAITIESIAIVDPAASSSIDDDAAEDIRHAERRRIADALAKAVADAVPRQAEDYIAGFKDGANFVAEQVLGLTIDVPRTAD